MVVVHPRRMIVHFSFLSITSVAPRCHLNVAWMLCIGRLGGPSLVDTGRAVSEHYAWL